MYAAMTNAQILLPVAAHSEGWGFSSPINKYRGIVEDAVFDRLGRPLFFDEAVDHILGRIAARIEGERITARPEACATRAPQESGEQDNGYRNGKSMRFAPQGDRIWELAPEEPVRLKRGIEERFVRSGKFGLEPACAS